MLAFVAELVLHKTLGKRERLILKTGDYTISNFGQEQTQELHFYRQLTGEKRKNIQNVSTI